MSFRNGGVTSTASSPFGLSALTIGGATVVCVEVEDIVAGEGDVEDVDPNPKIFRFVRGKLS